MSWHWVDDDLMEHYHREVDKIMAAALREDEMAKSKGEGSKADMRQDRAGAKKAGMSMKKYEGSAADRRADKARIGKKR